MKNKVILAVLALALLISGCKQVTDKLELKLNSISFTADITYYNENYIADCVIDESGKFSAQLTSPENLTGLTLIYKDSECDIQYNGIKIDNAERFFPQNTSVGILNKVLSECKNDVTKSKKGNYELNGSFDGNDYTLVLAPTGLPISLQVSNFGMNVIFENVKII